MAVNTTAINTAIADTLSNASGLSFSQDFDELSEGIVDTPLLQIYWTGTQTDVENEADRTTFGKGVAQARMTFHADLYATQRSDIGDDMSILLPLVDAIHDTLDDQKTTLFGLATIKVLENWQSSMVIFDYATFSFVGARFVISIRTF